MIMLQNNKNIFKCTSILQIFYFNHVFFIILFRGGIAGGFCSDHSFFYRHMVLTFSGVLCGAPDIYSQTLPVIRNFFANFAKDILSFK